MIRTQIQLTPEQDQALKRMAARQGKSVAELIRASVDEMLKTSEYRDPAELRKKAIAAAGTFPGPDDLASQHDHYLDEAYK